MGEATSGAARTSLDQLNVSSSSKGGGRRRTTEVMAAGGYRRWLARGMLKPHAKLRWNGDNYKSSNGSDNAATGGGERRKGPLSMQNVKSGLSVVS